MQADSVGSQGLRVVFLKNTIFKKIKISYNTNIKRGFKQKNI